MVVAPMDKHIDTQDIIETDTLITLPATKQQQSSGGGVEGGSNENNDPASLLRQQIHPSVARAEASHGEHARSDRQLGGLTV